jgi:hypothetical protein
MGNSKMNKLMVFQWFLNWVCSKLMEDQFHKISIITIDNPGWGVTIDIADKINEKIILADENISEKDWYFCAIKNNKFEGDGGPFNLIDILQVLQKWIEKNNKNLIKYSNNIKLIDILVWLEKWYYAQCDGDWEHQFGIKIETIDKNRWSVQITIQETEMEDKLFPEINIRYSEKDWIYCSLKNGHFDAECGLLNLPEVLQIFRTWTESFSSSEKII